MRRDRHPSWFAIAVVLGTSLASCSSGEEPPGPSGPPPPTILSLAAVPSMIEYGESAELIWKTTHAGRVQLRDGPLTLLDTAAAPNGLFRVAPELTTTYRLEASGEGGRTEADVTVSVRPVVLHLSTNVTGEVVIGRPVLVSWKTGGARELSLRSGETHVQPIPESKIREGSLWVAAPENGVFTLIARSGELESSRSVGVSSRPLAPPRIERFVATPPLVTKGRGDSVQIAWEVTGASTLSLQVDDVVVDLAGRSLEADQIDLPISATSELSLIATNPAGRDQQLLVVGAVDPPAIEFFRSSRERVPAGHGFELSWATVGATKVHLLLGDELLADDLPPTGASTQTLAAAGRFLLRAFNPAGAYVEAERYVAVGPPLIHRFEADRSVVPASVPLTVEWEVTGGVHLSVLDPDGLPIAGCETQAPAAIAAGSCVIESPALLGEYAYQLVVVDESQVASTRSITLRVVDGPTIEFFEVSPPSLDLGEPITVRWRTEPDRDGAWASLYLRDDQGNHYDLSGLDPEEGSLEIQPTTPGRYHFTLEAQTPETSPATAEASATVWALATAHLAAGPPIFDPVFGFEVVLEFSTENATTLQIWLIDEEGTLVGEPIFSTEDPSELEEGEVVVHLDRTTSFRLLVTNGNGTQTHVDYTVEIEDELAHLYRWR